jgi:yecA family protein
MLGFGRPSGTVRWRRNRLAVASEPGNLCAKMDPRSVPTASLSHVDYQELAAFLDDVGLLEIEGTLGLLHAVAIASSVIPPSAWLPLVLSLEQDNALDAEEMNVFLGLLMRQHNAVVEGLSRGAVIMPEAHEEEACVSFARGFVAGAELDPEWRGNEERWDYVEPIAYLAGRLDLVTDETQARLGGVPNITAVVCGNMEPLIGNANLEFGRARPRGTPIAVQTARRVGRNDPCPCGAGKKYKRCCGAI